MAEPQYKDTIADIAGNPELYRATDFRKLSLEQVIRLMQLHYMKTAEGKMKDLAQTLKKGHRDVQELHKLQALINALTNQVEGETRGTLDLTHTSLNDKTHKYFDLIRKIRSGIKTTASDKDGKHTILDLTDPKNAAIREELAKLLNIEVKDSYNSEEWQGLIESLEKATNIDDKTILKQVTDIHELRERLKEAKDKFGIDFKLKDDGKYDRDERTALMTAAENRVKDYNLDNDMNMHDLQRFYQERLEILQMARGLLKTLHDDKVHKARSAGSK